ncbi:3-hydroxyacyl-CoA dehydrogenase [Aspergillus sclerotialis]|uniref:3-hydroxyacyl-CoA dehydrogenase n=1 Tax=Aspergillus sclerotialis TaxID=2070753 RepID=A0A3A2ZD11_9EURO|nr:3-hydroxyacyl-CoA dehydrogenase [Aspergillus sclerotialis]
MPHQNGTHGGSMQDMVVLITGGANGAGANLAQLCCQSGAFVCIGDVDRANGEALAQKCREVWPAANEPGVPPRAVFHHADVTDYQSVVNLFDKAFETFKRIDHVVAAVVATASIFDHGDSFDHALTLRTVREAPLCKVVDVNLLGSLFVTRIASVYLRHNRGVDNDRSILLLAPGSTQSDQARQGVEGIMRSLRSYFASPYRHNLRINTISPVNKPNTFKDVALVSAGVLTDPSLHGKSLFIEGGRASEIEPAAPEVKVPSESPSTAIGNGMGQKVAAAAGGVP